MKPKNISTRITAFLLLLLCTISLIGCSPSETDTGITKNTAFPSSNQTNYKPESVYTGQPYIEINQNIPDFSDNEITTTSFESYGDLDELGRCTTATACISTDLMPTEERGTIGSVKPTGWHTVKYPDIISDLYLYNRCHLIGYQLTGENANERNLITGTRYLNIEGMLPFENQVTDYIKETGNHVWYQVTPDFHNDELIARGVYMQAYSVEDDGAGISFSVYCYNVQPGITIDYTTGDSHISTEDTIENTNDTVTATGEQEQKVLYVLNTSTKKYHNPDCDSVSSISDANKRLYYENDTFDISDYTPCKRCLQ